MDVSKKDYFDVCVKVHKCSNMSTQNIFLSTQVSVQVGDEKRYTKVIQHTSKPLFYDYFVFTKFVSLVELMDMLITISALHVKKGVRVRMLIGCITIDVSTLWHQPDRRLRKRFTLSVPSDKSMQKTAFVECDLRVSARYEYIELLRLLTFETVDTIGNKRARYKVSVYYGIGLHVQVVKKQPKLSVRMLYAGKTGITTKRQLREFVVWNEQISVIELFPPVRQNLTVEVCVGKKVLAGRRFNLIDFFKICPSGFHNIFGPTFVHLYSEGDLYCGSLLISLESEILGQLRGSEHEVFVRYKDIEPIDQTKYGMNRKFVCYLLIFELMIMKENCDKEDIYVSLEIGSNNIQTKNFTAVVVDNLVYVPFNEQKPCVSLECEWPDCCHRLYNSNLLASLADELREKLSNSEVLISKGCEEEARKILTSQCKTFQRKVKNILHLFSKGITELDSKQRIFLRQKINLLASLLVTEIDLASVIELCTLFLGILDSCSEDIQDSLPLVKIELIQGEFLVGSISFHPRHLIFSEVIEKRGQKSCKLNNLLFKAENGEVVARMDAWLWLGKQEQIERCKEHIPPGYKPFSQAGGVNVGLPSHLIYPSTHTYTAICHIHSGYIDAEAIGEGECDSFVKVCFFNQCKRTITAKRTLAPIWNETLIFPDIKLYISPTYLVENPPHFTVQLWNETSKLPKLIDFRLVSSTVRLHPLTTVPKFALSWWDLGHNCEVLADCEVYKVSPESETGEFFSMRRHGSLIPRYLEPPTVSYRLEVVFWGMRPSYARTLRNIVQPQILIQISTATLSSSVIPRANTTFNFTHDTQIVSLNLPENKIHSPPLIVKVMSNFKYLTSITEKNIYRFEHNLPKKSEWDALSARHTSDRSATSSVRVAFPDLIPEAEVKSKHASSLGAILEMPSKLKSAMSDMSFFARVLTRESPSQVTDNSEDDESSEDDEMEQDWWDRYWNNQFVIYNDTLENQEEFSGFTDVLSTFSVKPKKDGAKNFTEIGKLKAIFSLYKWPVGEPVVTLQGQDPEMGVLKWSELKNRVNLLVRVYSVKATDLYPSDLNGKSDPYIEIATPTKTVSDKLNKIMCDLNPVFGNFLDIVATLPMDSLLAVRVMDWDAITMDDVIGETIIDIENRYYSKHRATCGLPETYSTAGPDVWRDIETPCEILERLCNAHNLPLPQYNDRSVVIGTKEFELPRSSLLKEDREERLALTALNRWHEMPIVGCRLVGEHVETRSLFREDHPGLVRGKLTMWVDIFDLSHGPIPLPIDISPRAPQAFELRVNILNTKRIPLHNQICTDIIVSGWLGNPKTVQKTDVHYNSYTGEGNFNWRFVFPFLYNRKEKKIVFYEKNMFDIGKTDVFEPTVLHLEVHNSEGLMEDSLIGGMILELPQMPKGASSVRMCRAERMFDPGCQVDLFKVETLSGWWPFLVNKTMMRECGFLEAEFFLITAEEARKCPAGLGRSPPDPLPLPLRAQGREPLVRAIEHFLVQYNCNTYFGLTLQIVIVLSIIALVALLFFIMPSAYQSLKPWLGEVFSIQL